MNGLKTLVIGMGLLIVIGIGLIGYGLSRSGHRADSTPTAVSAAAPGGYFASELPVPHGAKLTAVTATSDRLVLHFSHPDGDRILLLDAHSGQVTGSVTLTAESH